MIGVFAALPWLWGIPKGADTLLHFYRSVQMEHMIGQGVLFSPWAPDMAYGFGYPIFNYYAPLSYYLTSIPAFVGLNLELAFQAIFVFSLVLSSLGMFLWTRDLMTDPAALVAAAMFTLSPYMMVDAVHRGALAELLALSLLPWILWAFRRYLVFGGWGYALVSVVSFAALILTHNITALIFTPIVIFYIFLVTVSRAVSPVTRIGFGWTRPIFAACLLVLGLGLSAFFWIPAMLEQDLVQITQLILPSDFNYANNFLSFLDLIALPYSADLHLVNQVVPISLSLVAIILGLIGVFSFKRFLDQPEKIAHLVSAAIAFAGCLYLTLPISTWIWESVPLLQFLQFPWRMLGLATFSLAFLAGFGTETILNFIRAPFIRSLVPALLVGLSVLYIFPWQYSNYYSSIDQSIFGMTKFESDSGYLGTTSTAEYLPIQVDSLPSDSQIKKAHSGVKLQTDELPVGAAVEAADYRPLTYDLILNSNKPFKAKFNTFYFDGWRAWIDDESAPIVVTDDEGLISIDIPAGRHELHVHFAQTPVRLISRLITLVSLFLIGTMIWVIRRRGAADTLLDGSTPGQGSRSAVFIIALLLVALAFFKIKYLDPGGNPLLNTRLAGDAIVDVDEPLRVEFEDQMVLMGVDRSDEIVSGEDFEITLFWRAAQDLEREYSVSALIIDQNGIIVAQSDRQHPGVKPTTFWGLGDYAADTREITLPTGAPPGEYTLRVIVYEYGHPDNRLEVLDSAGNPTGQPADVVSLTVLRPSKQADLEDVSNIQLDDIALWEDVSLVGYSLPEHVIRAGDTIFPVFYWRALGNPRLDHKIMVGLLAEDGQLVELERSRMIEGFPSFKWEEDDLWRVVHPMLLPPSLEAGPYLFMIGPVDGVPVSLGVVEVDAPSHSFEKPESANEMEVMFGDVAQLVGYEILIHPAESESLEVILHWRAASETTEEYKTFVQLLDEDNRLVAGSDMVPGNWDRPTTGWIAGEYITEGHLLSIPDDLRDEEYRVLIGVYNADDLQRLETESGLDSWFIPEPVEFGGG